MRPIPGTEKEYACDTLILSVGLIPENELSLGAGVVLDERSRGAVVDEHYQTSVEGIFAAGNVLQVHDLVDFVSLEAESLADGVVRYIRSGHLPDCPLEIRTDGQVTHTVPHRISGSVGFKLSLRVREPRENCTIEVFQGNWVIGMRRMKRAIPAEMIQIPIGADKLNTEQGLEVRIS